MVCTTRKPSSKLNTPPTVKAVYQPSEFPATPTHSCSAQALAESSTDTNQISGDTFSGAKCRLRSNFAA